MRFKATVSNPYLLTKVLSALEKVGKMVVVKLTTKELTLVITSNEGDGIQVWSELEMHSVFEAFRIESQNNNCIGFWVGVPNLLGALRSNQDAIISVKLTKKAKKPYLSFSLSGPMLNATQDVPIQMISSKDLSEYREPDIGSPEVEIMFPSLKNVRTVVDRMKSIGEDMTVAANMKGELTLRVVTDKVDIATFYQNLQHPERDTSVDGAKTQDSSQTVAVTFSVKKFCKVLFCYQANPSHAVCLLRSNQSFLLYLVLDGGAYMTYSIPVLVS